MSSSEKTIETLTKTIVVMSNELAFSREQVAALTEKLSEKSSSKTKRNHKPMNLFDDQW